VSKKNIKFIPNSEFADQFLDAPVPAASLIPEWFKKINKKINDKLAHRFPDGKSNKTVKACIPFLDTLTSGYIITAPCDIVFVDPNDYDGQRILWDVSWNVIEGHPPGQLGGMPLPEGYSTEALKWTVPWGIKTPPGYSLLYTHPFNRFDLPFHTLTGIVDTDTFDVPVNLPFLIKDNFIGKIEKGTPIAQVLPIKRDHWVSKKEEYHVKNSLFIESMRTIVDASYRLQWWNKKRYD
jgi:hypothetical protein